MTTPPPELRPGTLYLVATPIGNLEDITLRALRILRECSVIAAEDTRRAGRLLRHFDIKKPLVSYHKFNEAQRSSQLLKKLDNGDIIALISDAGTPGISDPGQRLTMEARAAGHKVESAPGPCALITALSTSGMPTDQFHFIGFPPRKSGARRRMLESVASIPGTLVFYESPHRIAKFLAEIAALWPECPTFIGRELTKKFEEQLTGKISEIAVKFEKKKPKGEFVVLLGEPRIEDVPATS